MLYMPYRRTFPRPRKSGLELFLSGIYLFPALQNIYSAYELRLCGATARMYPRSGYFLFNYKITNHSFITRRYVLICSYFLVFVIFVGLFVMVAYLNI